MNVRALAGRILGAGKPGEGAAAPRTPETDRMSEIRVRAAGGDIGSAWKPTGPQVRVPQQVLNFADWRLDPQEFGHRQTPVPGSNMAGPFMRHPTLQDRSQPGDDGQYPLPPRARYPSAYDEGYYAGELQQDYRGASYYDGIVNAEGLDQGPPPQRIPREWHDKLQNWEGLRTHGAGTVGLVAHTNHWVHLYHPRPAYPTRGLRSVSGVLASQGPTASRARIPAVFVPSSVG